jgi:hypothetical protein
MVQGIFIILEPYHLQGIGKTGKSFSLDDINEG